MEKKQGNFLAIIVMILLFGMISFVTNLASPMGDILKNQFSVANWMGTLGVLANFIAYAVMGIPAGVILKRKGYKMLDIVKLYASQGKLADDIDLTLLNIGKKQKEVKNGR